MEYNAKGRDETGGLEEVVGEIKLKENILVKSPPASLQSYMAPTALCFFFGYLGGQALDLGITASERSLAYIAYAGAFVSALLPVTTKVHTIPTLGTTLGMITGYMMKQLQL